MFHSPSSSGTTDLHTPVSFNAACFAHWSVEPEYLSKLHLMPFNALRCDCVTTATAYQSQPILSNGTVYTSAKREENRGMFRFERSDRSHCAACNDTSVCVATMLQSLRRRNAAYKTSFTLPCVNCRKTRLRFLGKIAFLSYQQSLFPLNCQFVIMDVQWIG